MVSARLWANSDIHVHDTCRAQHQLKLLMTRSPSITIILKSNRPYFVPEINDKLLAHEIHSHADKTLQHTGIARWASIIYRHDPHAAVAWRQYPPWVDHYGCIRWMVDIGVPYAHSTVAYLFDCQRMCDVVQRVAPTGT
jgi:hypothetical protein